MIYSTNQNGTVYGEERVFTTKSGYISGHKYVDLELPSGTKWSMRNMGATQECEDGDFYACGKLSPKDEYTSANCVTWNREMNPPDISGNPEYDAATANWCGSWRMPTESEVLELIDKCIWIWTTVSGVNSYRITSTNGNSIFLPAAATPNNIEDLGTYWTSTTEEMERGLAHFLLFGSSTKRVVNNPRFNGYVIRPVSN